MATTAWCIVFFIGFGLCAGKWMPDDERLAKVATGFVFLMCLAGAFLMEHYFGSVLISKSFQTGVRGEVPHA